MPAFHQSMSYHPLATPPATVDESSSPAASSTPSSSPRKRRLSNYDLLGEEAATAADAAADAAAPAASARKRVKTGLQSPQSTRLAPSSNESSPAPATSDKRLDMSLDTSFDMERVRDVIQHQFGLEILIKHNELRLINQEMAKCQIALEQLRRCHLMPYPVNIPTPEQMLDICSGQGPAVAQAGQVVPRWAPPYGVTDGPYARHYAKWLIPDPIFDGLTGPRRKTAPADPRSSGSAPEGRTTRKGYMESGSGASRGRTGGLRLGPQNQALPYAYPTPKDKAGPCILKRAQDGRNVKLACLDCFRENFSSTQGFINHCRIAHKRDFKSHEEAAIACGHPVDAVVGGDGGKGERPTATSSPPSTTTSKVFLHPFCRPNITDQEAYAALRSRISASMELYKQGKLPGVSKIPSLNDQTAHSESVPEFEPSQETPYLSQLIQRRNLKSIGNLKESVAHAKFKVPLEDLSSGEESDEAESPLPLPADASDSPARPRVMMRVPARSITVAATTRSAARPRSSKGRAVMPRPGANVSLVFKHKPNPSLSDEDLDVEDTSLGANLLVSNIAPSLVSDDGEYDSDEGCSVSGASDNLEEDSGSDIAEISLDDDHDARALRRGSSGMVVTPIKLRKDAAKHVTFISPVRSTRGRGRPRKIRNVLGR